jgi:hypothetical protein
VRDPAFATPKSSEQAQTQLPPVAIFVPLHEGLMIRRGVSHLEIAAQQQLVSHIFGKIARPALGSVEGDNPEWIAILAAQ